MFAFFPLDNSRALLTITSLVQDDKFDMHVIFQNLHNNSLSIIFNFKSLHSQFHVFALFEIN